MLRHHYRQEVFALFLASMIGDFVKIELRKLIVAVVFIAGLGGTTLISNALRTEARIGWEEEASNTARSLSGTLLGWLEESYAPLSGLAAITENSDDLTESEFLNAYDGLEARATAVFLESAALATLMSEEDNQSWKIKFSSDPEGALTVDKVLAEQPKLLDAVQVAFNRSGEMILGQPLDNGSTAQTVSPVALSTLSPAGSMMILGIIDYQALAKGLYELHVPEGVSLRIAGRFTQPQGPGEERNILDHNTPDILHTVPIRTVSAAAELLVSWDFDGRFSGGPNTTLANAMLIFGIGMTLSTVLIIYVLQSQNRVIQQRVVEATADLSEALSSISSSISYASHIQQSILPPSSDFEDFFAEHFIIWEPRDVVGGDIYWLRSWGEGTLLLLGDCTGHGVPGAFMTLIAKGALDRSVSEIPEGEVGALVQRMHQLIQSTQNQASDGEASREGMELGVCYFDNRKDGFDFCGARFSLFIDDGNEITEVKGERKGIGYARLPSNQTYKTTFVPLSARNIYYMTTDGFIDQIGGEKGRCFGKKRFIQTLGSLRNINGNRYQSFLRETLIEYQADNERLDDVAVIGFRK